MPLAVIAVSFAVSNRGDVAVSLWPFENEVVAPVFLVVLVPAVVTFILGGIVAWLSGSRDRRALRKTETAAERFRRERDEARGEAHAARQRSLEAPAAAPAENSAAPRLLGN